MRYLLPIGILLCAGLGATAEEQLPTSALIRNAIVVSDLDDSKHFYSTALGFTPGFDGDISGEWVDRLLQLEESSTVRFAVLTGAMEISGQDVTGAMIGLMQVNGNSVGDVVRNGGNTLARGEVVLAVVTDDIAAVYTRLRELDAEILVPPSESPNGRELEMVIRDPDGIRIHIVERLLDLTDPGNE